MINLFITIQSKMIIFAKLINQTIIFDFINQSHFLIISIILQPF
jgi:hypothetical protein